MAEGGPTSANPGGAKWCEQHERFECTRQRTKKRGDCHNIAVSGTDVCLNHGGQSLDVLKAKGAANKAMTAFSALAGVPTVEPGRAVLAMLQMSWLRLHLYAGLLEAQLAAQGGTADDVPADLDDVDPSDPAADGPITGGLIGHTYAPAKGGEGRVVTGEAPRALVVLEAAERDRIVRYAKVAHDMGIAEREVKLAEQQGQLLARVITQVLGDLELSPVQQAKAPSVIRTRLRAAAELEAGGAA